MKANNCYYRIASHIIILISICLVCCNCTSGPSEDFGAYYSRIITGAAWEKYDRTGEYADIIVDLGVDRGKFVFWRGANYLPYWENSTGQKYYVEELLPRKGDGGSPMFDKVNTYARVAIIKSNENQAIVHWRYLPEFNGSNPHTGVVATSFVDEYFKILVNGQVTRTVKKGTEKIDDWTDPGNQITQTFSMEQQGLVYQDLLPASLTHTSEETRGSSIISRTVSNPLAWFKFDEASGDHSTESIGGGKSVVSGDKTVWKRGVSGTALQFDGYKTSMKFPAVDSPTPLEAITLEGWLAIGAYPWSWCPIIQQVDDVPEEVSKSSGKSKSEFYVKYLKEDDKGYFLGIDGHGRPGFKIRVGGVWEELTADVRLERKTWVHIAATYSKTTGKMSLFVDGERSVEKEIARADIELSSRDIQIGMGKDRRPTDPVRENTFPGTYSFDGLIDEVKLYDKALTDEEITEIISYYNHEKSADLDKRVLPAGEQRSIFGAYYANLKFYDSWDNMWRFSEHSDVVVEFDNNPSKFIFWKGVSYIPMMVNENGFWYSNEFNETWGTSGGEGCQEPMSDKQCLYNHVRILENTPARAVVHYRFPLVDVNKIKANYVEETGWYDVADWYFYIYPDGVAAKVEQLWTSGERNHEWQESMAIFGPDQHPHDLIERTETFTIVRVDGTHKTYDWNPLAPDAIDEPEHANIHHVNYKGEYDPVTIVDKILWSNIYGGEITDYAIFPTWNHWPVAQMPSDGRYASYPDRTCHSSLSHIYPPDYDQQFGDRPYQTKLFMEGMLRQSPLELIPLARSWIQPPMLNQVKGCTGYYDKSQRAYHFETESDHMSMTLMASEENPVQNICLVFKHWNSKKEGLVSIDGEKTANKQGIVRDTDGSYKLVIWIEMETDKPFNVDVQRLG